jgi:hypothetical protein
MARMMADCRRFASDSNCTLTIIGEENEVMETAAAHAVAVHSQADSPEFRAQLRNILEPESAYQTGSREPEPFPA